MASRMQVATYVADRLKTERHSALKSAAAWLSAKGRARQAPYLARDVAQILAGRGYVMAKVTTAQPLSHEALAKVEHFIKKATGGHELELETAVDPKMVGGIKIETPGQTLDASVRTKLDRFVANAGIMTMEAKN